MSDLDQIRSEIDIVDKNIILLISWKYKEKLKYIESGKELKYIDKIIDKITSIHKNVDGTVLTNLLLRRFQLIKEVWEYKTENKIEVKQNSRFEDLLNKLKEIWKKYNLKEKDIEEIWNTMHHHSIQYQEKLINLLK
jgi:chorismate mutase